MVAVREVVWAVLVVLSGAAAAFQAEATQRGAVAERDLNTARSSAAEQANTFAAQFSTLQARLTF